MSSLAAVRWKGGKTRDCRDVQARNAVRDVRRGIEHVKCQHGLKPWRGLRGRCQETPERLVAGWKDPWR